MAESGGSAAEAEEVRHTAGLAAARTLLREAVAGRSPAARRIAEEEGRRILPGEAGRRMVVRVARRTRIEGAGRHMEVAAVAGSTGREADPGERRKVAAMARRRAAARVAHRSPGVGGSRLGAAGHRKVAAVVGSNLPAEEGVLSWAVS